MAANLSLTRVNHKIAQARQLLQGVDADSLKPIQRGAIIEAAAFHMVCAYQHYLREIAETYGLKGASAIADEPELIAAFASAHKHPAEAEELLSLQGDASSWLARLQAYYQSLWSQPKPAKTPADENFISLVEVEVELVDVATLQHWLEEFVYLIQRQRETSAEF